MTFTLKNFFRFTPILAPAVLCLTLLSSYVISGTLAKYVTGENTADSASVAAFVFELNDGTSSQMVNLSGVKKPGDSQTFTFSVTNSRAGTVSEVAIDYTISLQMNGSIPLTATITEAGTATQGGGTAAQASPLLSAAITDATTLLPITATTPQLSFGAGKMDEKTYNLTVTWPAEQNGAIYASARTAAEAILTVTAQQAD